MSTEGNSELHGTTEVRTDGASIVVELPREAVERSGVTVGETVMVGSIEDGPLSLVPWSEDDIRGMLDRD